MTERYAYQNTTRNKNMKLVKDTLAVVRGIHGQDYIFTAAALSKLTGITRQTLSLPVYRTLWDSNYTVTDSRGDIKIDTLDQFATINQLQSTIDQLESKLSQSEVLKQRYFNENKTLKKQCSELLFMNLSILRRMRLYGISADDLVDELLKSHNHNCAEK